MSLNIKKVFRKKGPEEKLKRKEEKKIKRSARYEKKAIKKYWKTYDHPKEIKSDKSVYRRMKKNLRKSDRINNGRHPDSKIKRAFWPKRDTKRVKNNNNQKSSKFKLFNRKKG